MTKRQMPVEYADAMGAEKSRLNGLIRSHSRVLDELREAEADVDAKSSVQWNDTDFRNIMTPAYDRVDALTAERDHLAGLLDGLDGRRR